MKLVTAIILIIAATTAQAQGYVCPSYNSCSQEQLRQNQVEQTARRTVELQRLQQQREINFSNPPTFFVQPQTQWVNPYQHYEGWNYKPRQSRNTTIDVE